MIIPKLIPKNSACTLAWLYWRYSACTLAWSYWRYSAFTLAWLYWRYSPCTIAWLYWRYSACTIAWLDWRYSACTRAWLYWRNTRQQNVFHYECLNVTMSVMILHPCFVEILCKRWRTQFSFVLLVDNTWSRSDSLIRSIVSMRFVVSLDILIKSDSKILGIRYFILYIKTLQKTYVANVIFK